MFVSCMNKTFSFHGPYCIHFSVLIANLLVILSLVGLVSVQQAVFFSSTLTEITSQTN